MGYNPWDCKSQTQQLNNPKPPVPLPPGPSPVAAVSLFSLWVCFCFMNEWMKVAPLCPTLCNPMDYTVNGILQARILEWVAVSISSGSSQPRDQTQVTHRAGGFFTSWATRETFLFHRYVHLCYILDSTCNWYHMVFLFFFRTYFISEVSMVISTSIHIAAYGVISCFLWGSNSSLNIHWISVNIHWKDWRWSWSSDTLATRCEELTHWKRPWCWEGLSWWR